MTRSPLHFHLFSIVSLMRTSFCGINSTSVDKTVRINIKIEWPHHKTHVLTIKFHDLTITTHGPITEYSDL